MHRIGTGSSSVSLGKSKSENRIRDGRKHKKRDGSASVRDFPLFHITARKNLAKILKEGLQPSTSELTKRAYIRRKDPDLEDNLEYAREHNDQWLLEESEVRLEDLEEEFDDLPPMVFSVNHDGLETMYKALKESDLVKDKDLIVLGIDADCARDFKSRRIGSDYDIISEDAVSPECLHVIEDWKEMSRSQAKELKNKYRNTYRVK